MGMNTDAVQRLYVAYFNRPADPVSMSVYESLLPTDTVATQAQLQVLAETYFSPSSEYTSLYAGMSNTQIVNQLYQNIFGREAEPTGLVFWAGELTAGTETVASIALQLSYSAQGTDADVVSNRIEAANAFTTGLNTTEEITGYSGDAAAASARSWLATVGSDTASKDAAVAGVDAAITAAVTAGGGGSTDAPQVFTLTASAAGDDFSGGSGDDIFNSANTARYQDVDVLDGGEGTDTLTAKLNSTTAHDAFVNDIEIINFDVLGTSTILANQITGATNVNLTGGAVLTMTNAAGGITYSVAESGTGLTLVQATTDTAADAVTVNLGAGALGTLTLGDANVTDFETFNLIVDGTTSTTLTEANTAAIATGTGESVVVTGSSDAFELNISDAALGGNTTIGNALTATIDASEFTGELTLDIGSMETEHVDASDWSGVDIIKIQTDDTGSDDNHLIDVESGTVVEIAGTEDAANTVTIDPDGTGTGDTLTVKLDHATAGSSIDITSLTVDGFETVTVESSNVSTASATVTNVIDLIAGLSTDARLNVTGSSNFTATGIENTFTTINVTNTATTNLTVDSGGSLTYTAGAGADRLELDTVADLATGDSLTGGDGEDTLAFSALPSALSATQLGLISGFEILEFEETLTLTAATTTLTLDTGMDTLRLTGALSTEAAKILTVNAASGFTLDMGAHTAAGSADDLNIVIAGAANAGTADVVNLKVQGIGANTTNAGFQIDNVETLNIDITGDQTAAHVYTISDIDGAQLKSITVSSSNPSAALLTASDALTITTAETTLLETVDMAAMSGTTDITGLASKLIATGATVTGGSGADSITGGAGADVITGNAGGDTLLGGNGNDNISGGAGDDGIEGEAGADTLTGGAGDNTFTLDDGHSTEASMDTITDFTAGAADADFDTLAFAGTPVVAADIAIGAAHDVKDHTTDTDTDVSAYVTNGIIQLTGADAAGVDTLAEWIDIAEDTSVNGWSDDANLVETVAIGFVFSGDTYILYADDGDEDGTFATESIVKLTGLTATAVSTTEAADTVHVS
jgi:S-layer protein